MSENDGVRNGQHGETISGLLALASSEEGNAAMQSALDELNRALKPDAEISIRDLKSYSSATLARFLQYFALAKMLEKPGRRSSDRPPKGATYELVCKLYNDFQEKFAAQLGEKSPILPNLRSGTVRDYCSFHTFSTGSDTERFYSGLADRKSVV